MAIGKKLHIRKGDTVEIISGEDRDRRGKVIAAFPKQGKILVEKVNMVSKHQKPRGLNQTGGIINVEAPIYASKAMLVCNKCNEKTRVGRKILEDGSKVRVCKKCGETFND